MAEKKDTKKPEAAEVVEVTKGVTMPVNEKPDTDFVPHSQAFHDTNDGLVGSVAYAIKEDMPVLLIGETGVGKTSAVRYLANKTKNAFRRLNLNGQVTVDEFVGKILINKEGTYWVDGILTEALRKGHWLLLDELNAALPEVLFVLQSLLDDDRYIVLSDKDDKEIVRPHKNFRLFATMNPSDSGNYVGTKDLNKALMSRFPMVLEVKFPTPPQEKKIIESHLHGYDVKESEKNMIINLANSCRTAYKQEEMDFVFSTRDVLNWIKVFQFTQNWKRAAELTFLGKCNKADYEAISALMKVEIQERPKLATEQGADVKMNLTKADIVDNGCYVMMRDTPTADHPHMMFTAGTMIQANMQMTAINSANNRYSSSQGATVMVKAVDIPSGGTSNRVSVSRGTIWGIPTAALMKNARKAEQSEIDQVFGAQVSERSF